MSDSSDQFINVNGKITKMGEGTIPAVSSGLYYGAGCFETLRYDDFGFFRFSKHIKRLNRGLSYLGVSESELLDENDLLEQVRHLIKRNQFENETLRIRIQISLEETKGYHRDENPDSFQVITCQKITLQNSNAATLKTSKTRVIPDVCRPSDLKLSNMLHYRQAFREAADAGADDALMLTTGGFMAECSVANLFWKKGDSIFTPSTDCDILPGLMRKAVIELLEEKFRMNLVEGRFKPKQLLKADAIWLTNSIKEVQAVEKIDGTVCKQEPEFLKQLSSELEKLKQEENL